MLRGLNPFSSDHNPFHVKLMVTDHDVGIHANFDFAAALFEACHPGRRSRGHADGVINSQPRTLDRPA
jgi:hypothetical protein